MSVFRSLMMANAAVDPLKVPLTFTAEEAGSTVALNTVGTQTISSMHYRMGKSGAWMPYTAGTVIDLPNIGDSCQFWNGSKYLSDSSGKRANFKLTGKVGASGNIQSLLNWRTDGYPFGCFNHLFLSQSALTKMPIIPAVTSMQAYYLNNAFHGTSIAKAEIPGMPLLESCYYRTFMSCTKLKEIRVHFTEWHNTATNEWVSSVSPTGTFYKPSALPEEYGVSRIPTGWTVVNID